MRLKILSSQQEARILESLYASVKPELDVCIAKIEEIIAGVLIIIWSSGPRCFCDSCYVMQDVSALFTHDHGDVQRNLSRRQGSPYMLLLLPRNLLTRLRSQVRLRDFGIVYSRRRLGRYRILGLLCRARVVRAQCRSRRTERLALER